MRPFCYTVYIIGELVKATGYGDASVLAEWRIKAGEKKWKCVNGAVKGSTWTAERNLVRAPQHGSLRMPHP